MGRIVINTTAQEDSHILEAMAHRRDLGETNLGVSDVQNFIVQQLRELVTSELRSKRIRAAASQADPIIAPTNVSADSKSFHEDEPEAPAPVQIVAVVPNKKLSRWERFKQWFKRK